MKKGQSISLNTIIIAAIALLVLVIVSLIFMARMGWFGKNSNDCEQFKGECDHGRNCAEGYSSHALGVCYNSDSTRDYANTCCVRDVTG